MPPLSLVALELAPTATVFLPPVLAPLPPLRRFQPKQWHQYPMPSHCQHLFTLALLPNTTALSEFFTSENAPAATPFSDKTVDVEPIAPPLLAFVAFVLRPNATAFCEFSILKSRPNATEFALFVMVALLPNKRLLSDLSSMVEFGSNTVLLIELDLLTLPIAMANPPVASVSAFHANILSEA